jgi:hypothetical protein
MCSSVEPRRGGARDLVNVLICDQTLPTDLLGSLYYEFDVENLKKSIKTALRQWVARQAFGNGGTSSFQAVARS